VQIFRFKFDSTENKRVFGTDLQLVNNENQEHILTQQQGVDLNKLGVDAMNEEEIEMKKIKAEMAKDKAKRKREEQKKQQQQYIEEPRRSGRSNKGVNTKLFFDS
jgi:hypothetical protein